MICNMTEINIKTIYIVTMYRFGDREKHSYIQGLYTVEKTALKEASSEEKLRGNKYSAEIIKFNFNSSLNRWLRSETVLGLGDTWQ